MGKLFARTVGAHKEKAASAAYVHFVLSLRPAKAVLMMALNDFNKDYIDNADVTNLIIGLVVDAVLYKETYADDQYEPSAKAVEDLESIGFAKANAHEVFHQVFDAVASAITDLIPNFGDERYRENYDYAIRNTSDLHIAVAACVYTDPR